MAIYGGNDLKFGLWNFNCKGVMKLWVLKLFESVYLCKLEKNRIQTPKNNNDICHDWLKMHVCECDCRSL